MSTDSSISIGRGDWDKFLLLVILLVVLMVMLLH